MVYIYALGNYTLPSNNMQGDGVVNIYLVDKHRIMWFFPDLTLSHLNKCVYHTILDYTIPMASGNIIDENIKRLYYVISYGSLKPE